MKVLIFLVCGLSLAVGASAQMGVPSQKGQSQAAAQALHDVVPLPSIKSLSPEQASGKRLFVQRCSVCHLPALPSYSAYGPLLDKTLVEDRGDDAVRLQIAQGSARMPGFQYTLSGPEIDQVLSYLKTLPAVKKQ
jgi:mono/diheme cytochrome c family protein